MKITVTKENLNNAIRKVISAISSKGTLPILNNILIEAEGDTVCLSAYDLEIFIHTTIPAIVHEPGATTVPSKKFAQIASDLPAGDITIDTDADEHSTITCQRSRFKIHGLSAISYQKPEDFQEEWSFTMPAKDLFKNLAKVSYARSDDESRRTLTGVLFSVRGGTWTIAATDGRRLALVEKPLDSAVTADGDIILPCKVTAELAKSLDPEANVAIRISSSMIVFETPETTITSKLLDGVYPNYRQVIPSSFVHKLEIPRAVFSDALRRVSLVVTDANLSISLALSKDSLVISGNSADIGEASEAVDVEYDGPEMTINFNPQFYSEPLKLLDCDKFVMNFTDDLSPVELSGDDGFIYILMPMRG